MSAQRPGRLGLSLATALLGIALASAAFGQAPSSAASEPPLYRVEVIVFAHNRGNPAEEDFAYIARRESMSGARTRGRSEIAQFDFGPYLPEEGVSGETSGLRNTEGSARSRLLLGQDEAADGADQTTPRAGAANEPADAALPDATDAADADTTDPTSADGVQAAEDEAGTAFDPFGGDPGNAVAAFRFRLLEPSELELGAVRQRLARGYTPLVHGGWIQEGLPQLQARPFDLAYLGVGSPSGTIRLHVSRFLHLTVDLEYRPRSASENAGPSGSDAFGSSSAAPGFGVSLAEVDVPNRYHLKAERRMRSGEVHYFDHPFFGVIAVVRPYEPPAPPETESVRPAA